MSSDGILAGSLAMDVTTEPYYEPVSITFIFGPTRRSYSVSIPIDSFNFEVSSPNYAIPKFFPSHEPTSITVQLPDYDIPWDEAIKQFTRYLFPPRKNGKRVTDSPAGPLQITSRVIIPLILLARRLHLKRLEEKLTEQVEYLQCSQALTVCQQIVRFDIKNINFMDVLLEKLAEELPTFRAQTFGGIEMASVILSVLQRAQPKDDPVSVIEWLYVIFSKFVETRAFEKEITEIINLLKCTDANCAFIVWGFGNFIDGIAGCSIFEEFVSEYQLQRIEMIFVLPVQGVIWLIDSLNRERNRSRLMQLVCRWLRTNNPMEDKKKLFKHTCDCELFKYSELTGGDLCVLLPFAYGDSFIFEAMMDEIKSDFTKWRGTLSIKNKDLAILDWQSLLSCFDLMSPPRIQDQKVSNLRMEMRNFFKPLDSIFYHWITTNVKDVTIDIIISYMELASTEPSHVKKNHRRLIIIDILNHIGGEALPLRNKLIDEFMRFADFSNVISKLITKKNIALCDKTLEFMQSVCRESAYLMTQFTQLIECLDDVERAHKLIIPVNETSVVTCLKILSRVIRPTTVVRQNVLSILRLVLGTLNARDLHEAMRIFTFKEMFNSPAASMMLLHDEDTALFYALKCNEIDPRIPNNAGIYWPHVSLRAMAMITNDERLQREFQFDLDEDSLLNQIGMSPLQIKPWCQCTPPRIGTYTNLATLPPSRVMIYVLADPDFNPMFSDSMRGIMQFIGIPQFEIHYVSEHSRINNNCDVHVIYMPNSTTFEKDYSVLLQSILDVRRQVPLVVNANAALQLQEVFPLQWNAIVGSETCLMDYDVSEDTEVTWNEPSPTMLPRKQDLYRFPLVGGADPLFNTIPCSSGPKQKWRANLEWKNGRIIGGSISGSSVSIINCDFVINDATGQPIDLWIRVKQTAQCLLAVMCESIAGTDPVFQRM